MRTHTMYKNSTLDFESAIFARQIVMFSKQQQLIFFYYA